MLQVCAQLSDACAAPCRPLHRRRDATLQLGDLQKNGLDGPEALYSIIYSGRNSMPGCAGLRVGGCR